MNDLRRQLAPCFQGRVCLMGLGNVELGDDGLGVRLVEVLTRSRVAGGVEPSVRIIIAGTTAEQHISRLAQEQVDHLIFLDAVEFGGTPGEVVFLNAWEMRARFPQVSTHTISLGLLAKWAESEAGVRAWLLGVQPESLKLGAYLSPRVRQSLTLLAELLVEVAQASSPAGSGGVSPPGMERGGTPLEPAAETAALQTCGLANGRAALC